MICPSSSLRSLYPRRLPGWPYPAAQSGKRNLFWPVQRSGRPVEIHTKQVGVGYVQVLLLVVDITYVNTVGLISGKHHHQV